MLAGQPFPGNAIRKGFGTVRPGFTQMPHEEGDVRPVEGKKT